MKQSTASRRLVKSPPELWAELSSEDALNRHLAGFGEIRITRVDPETTVAWEGDRVSGTVELTPAGWGTKVMLTATPARAAPVQRPAPATADPPPPATLAEPPPPAPKQGFFARLFRRRRDPAPVSGIPGPPTPAPDPSPPAPGPSPSPVPPPAPDPSPPTPAPTPPAPHIEAQPRPQLSAAQTVAILTDVLDDLGAAHHRPFSRD